MEQVKLVAAIASMYVLKNMTIAKFLYPYNLIVDYTNIKVARKAQNSLTTSF